MSIEMKTHVIFFIACLKDTESPALPPRPVGYISPCSGPHSGTVTQRTSASPVYHSNRKKLPLLVPHIKNNHSFVFLF